MNKDVAEIQIEMMKAFAEAYGWQGALLCAFVGATLSLLIIYVMRRLERKARGG